VDPTLRSSFVPLKRGEKEKRGRAVEAGRVCREGKKTLSVRLRGLALAELELLARSGLAGLLAFLGAAIARQEACLLQLTAALGFLSNEGAGDPVAYGLSLSAVPAAFDEGAHIVLVGELKQLKRLACDHHRGGTHEVFANLPAIDRDLPGAGGDPDARYRGLALTS
jgi:hypothetical protein